MENNELSALAVLKALADRLSDQLKVGGGGLRDKVDADLLAAYEETGVDRARAFVNGVPVGFDTVRRKAASSRAVPTVADQAELSNWLLNHPDGRRACRSLIENDPGKALKWAMAEGEVPPGVEMVRTDESERVEGTTLRVDSSKVEEALGVGSLLEAAAGLLGLPGGE